MTSKLKLLLKRQSSHGLQTSAEIKSHATETRQMAKSAQNLYRALSITEAPNDFVKRPGKRLARRRIKSAELGPIEDVLQCTICMERLKLPRMLPCQHTFCLECLKNQFPVAGETSMKCPVCQLAVNGSPDNLPTNLYMQTLLKVMENSKNDPPNGATEHVVRFAPVPEELKTEKESKCHVCNASCQADSRCRHCRQLYCCSCWTDHANELKGQLKITNEELCIAARKFDGKINDFRNNIEEMKEVVRKDTEQRMAELMLEQEERLRRADEMAAAGESSAVDIKQRIAKVHEELEAQVQRDYDCLENEMQKVKTFLDLQQKATELIATVSIWEQNALIAETDFEDAKPRLETPKPVGDPVFLYKHKVFTEKIIATRDTVQRPSGMALDPWRDQIIVTCPGSGQVVILDRKFKVLKRIYHQDMMAPQGVVFLEEPSEIFVTDKWKHCIFVFNRKGELQRRICGKGSGESQLRSPEGIAFHSAQNLLYVADTGNDRIQILRRDGSYCGAIGLTEKEASLRFGRNGLQLNQPTDVAVSANTVVVADCGNHKIKIFSLDGQILQTIGGLGTLTGFFKSPQAVCIDQKGNIVVGDTGNGRVQIFSTEGEFLRVVRGKGNRSTPFDWISGVLVKNNYDILVADSKNNTVHLF